MGTQPNRKKWKVVKSPLHHIQAQQFKNALTSKHNNLKHKLDKCSQIIKFVFDLWPLVAYIFILHVKNKLNMENICAKLY
jgi:transposase-like protein